ncbi:PTS system, mannose-specific IIB component [Malonomonas rubra DSM 5091]|uniref:PTS system, mannose-specific IIB component n=1 Tax=Malonomonas rubra DSM 5091 TaxID=1122189 RepID=A0A1M6DXS0_MALRU|nr:PTS sugar transporter subunit IIB [Malonomonas rubra]SHI77920.1 PTS system, mannose-specific IIB component [Malonomonas rubra DSM 5091]
MSLVLTRIDNRLIHGQVLETWVPYVHADCIVVANDEIASSPLKRMMMEASVPSRMRVEIGTVDEITALFGSGSLEKCKILLLFGNTADALRAYRNGLIYQRLNLGNLHAGAGKTRLSCTIFLDKEDIGFLQELDVAGVAITARCIPADSERSWKKLVPRRKLKQ